MLLTIKFCKVRVCEEERRLFYNIPLKTISEQTPTHTHIFSFLRNKPGLFTELELQPPSSSLPLRQSQNCLKLLHFTMRWQKCVRA